MTTMTPASTSAASGPVAACASDPELMFPPEDSQVAGEPNAQERRALARCRFCPILDECREQVLHAEMPFGVAGGMTVADRRQLRAHRRGLIPDRASSVMTSPDVEPAPVGDRTVDETIDGVRATAGPDADLDATVRSVLADQARFGHGADATRVANITGPRLGSSASRWEMALAAAVMVRRGLSVSATARHLDEQYTLVKRWRDRDQAREALVRGPARVSSSQRPRGPALTTGVSAATGASESDRGAA